MTYPNGPDEPHGPSRERIKFREESDVPDEYWELLDEEGLTIHHVREIFCARLKHKQTYRSVFDWVRSQQRGRTRLELLRRLTERREGVRYSTLADELGVRENYVRRLVGDLRDKGVVETPGRPAIVQFTNRGMYLLASDIAMLF